MKKRGNVVRHSLKDPLSIDPRLLRTGEEEIAYFPFVPTREELSPRPSVKGFGANGCLEVKVVVKPLDGCLLARISLSGTADLLDDHDLTRKEFPFCEEAELSLSSDPQMADVLPSSDGTYDLRPTLLALFYGAIPPVYSAIPLKKVEGEGYAVYSQDEYEKELSRRESRGENNPFSSLLKDFSHR